MSDTLVICNQAGQPGCDGNCGHARQHLRNRTCGPSACPDVNSYIVECRHKDAPRAAKLPPADIERLRSFEADHAPDGWPAIQMRDVSALLDEVERLRGICAGQTAS